MRFLFVVQGEGRGHMTQAIAMQNMLLKHGHFICGVIIGKSERRVVPDYFYENIKSKITPIHSPNFLTDKDNKTVDLPRTIFYNLSKVPFFWRNVLKIKRLVEECEPDYVINFYEFLCGVYFGTYKSKAKHICIGHQFLLEHRDFQFPKVRIIDKFWYFVNTYITSQNAHLKLALSFREMPNDDKQKVKVVPPLLRKEVLDIEPTKGDFLQAYVVNGGYTDDIINWHKSNDSIKIHLFSDRKDIADGAIIDKTLTFNYVNDVKFLNSMKDCKAYASTAGFESICEAMYLGKPVLLVPPKGHFEQQCNALDAVIAGAGIKSTFFDIEALLDFVDKNDNKSNEVFKNWVDSAESHFLKYLN
ncbi:MAG: glycosyltransferase family protein [Cytophagales bacterium]